MDILGVEPSRGGAPPMGRDVLSKKRFAPLPLEPLLAVAVLDLQLLQRFKEHLSLLRKLPEAIETS